MSTKTYPVPALTVHQPYAELIRAKIKMIENRTQAIKYRGPLIIHAAKQSNYLTKEKLADYQTMGVTAITMLCGCVNKESALAGKVEKLPETVLERLKTDEHAEGPFCWFLDSTKPLEFVPMPGRQGLWYPTPEEWEAIHQANPGIAEWIEFMLRGSPEA